MNVRELFEDDADLDAMLSKTHHENFTAADFKELVKLAKDPATHQPKSGMPSKAGLTDDELSQAMYLGITWLKAHDGHPLYVDTAELNKALYGIKATLDTMEKVDVLFDAGERKVIKQVYNDLQKKIPLMITASKISYRAWAIKLSVERGNGPEGGEEFLKRMKLLKRDLK